MPMHNPPHPGEVLAEWLSEVTLTEAARRLRVSRVSLSRIVNGAHGLSADMDLRLSKALGTTPGFWLGLQTDWDLFRAQRRFKASGVKPFPELRKAA
ncbi:MAG: HigA family addiction module antitoxin [Pseudomonadota bacterium]